MCQYLFVPAHTVPTEARRDDSSSAPGLSGSYELPNTGAGKGLRTSVRPDTLKPTEDPAKGPSHLCQWPLSIAPFLVTGILKTGQLVLGTTMY